MNAPETSPTQSTSRRFHAVDKDRLQVIIANKLSAAEIVVLHWAHINSSPERSCRIRLEQIAMQLDLAADTVSRALKRLADLQLVIRERQGRNLLVSVPDKFPRQTNRDEMSTIDRPNPVIKTAAAVPLEDLDPESKVKKSFEIGATDEPMPAAIDQAELLNERTQLAKKMEALGVWMKVSLALINRHGLDRVQAAYDGVQALRQTKKVDNPAGLIQHALRTGYEVTTQASKPPIDNLTPDQIRDIAVAAMISQSLGQQITDRQLMFIARYKADSRN